MFSISSSPFQGCNHTNLKAPIRKHPPGPRLSKLGGEGTQVAEPASPWSSLGPVSVQAFRARGRRSWSGIRAPKPQADASRPLRAVRSQPALQDPYRPPPQGDRPPRPPLPVVRVAVCVLRFKGHGSVETTPAPPFWYRQEATSNLPRMSVLAAR